MLNFGGPEMVWIFLLILVLFGAQKLPKLARSIGESLGEFKRARDEFERELRYAEYESEQAEREAKLKEDRESNTTTGDGSDADTDADQDHYTDPHDEYPHDEYGYDPDHAHSDGQEEEEPDPKDPDRPHGEANPVGQTGSDAGAEADAGPGSDPDSHPAADASEGEGESVVEGEAPSGDDDELKVRPAAGQVPHGADPHHGYLPDPADQAAHASHQEGR